MILLLTRDLREAKGVLRLKRILDKGFIWSPPAGGEAPAVGEAQASPSLYQEQTMKNGVKEISIFVDESGSFSPDVHSSRYYLVCMVFHNQSDSVLDDIARLNEMLLQLNLAEDHAIHAGPLVRWEEPYRNLKRQDRRVVFNRMMSFIRHAPIKFQTFWVDKKYVTSAGELHDQLLQQITRFLITHADDFNSFGKLKVYYDNGQEEVLALLKTAFAIFSSRVDFVPEVLPSRYRLFQAADMIATLELLRIKFEIEKKISETEKLFFLNIQSLKKNFFKPLDRKRWV
ncbi:MAG: DUF3800 domain-containing protein [Kiritimatiellae bacterium]|nr:DUF3800 domain-containing protein [Kiritimatiellia bacterium]